MPAAPPRRALGGSRGARGPWRRRARRGPDKAAAAAGVLLAGAQAAARARAGGAGAGRGQARLIQPRGADLPARGRRPVGTWLFPLHHEVSARSARCAERFMGPTPSDSQQVMHGS